MILTKMVKTKWNSKTVKHYSDLGHKYTFIGDQLEVPIEHLRSSSRATIYIQCDYCNKVFTREYQTVNMLRNKQPYNQKDCCSNEECIKSKIIESNNILFGEDYAKQNVDFQSQLEDRLEEKYGIRNVFQLEVVKEKSKETCKDKYGVEYYQQSDEGKEAYEKSCMEKYGYKTALQHPRVIEKIRNTNIEKYGVSQLMKLPHVVKERSIKRAKTVYENGRGVSTSKQQRYLAKILLAELNYPEGKVNMDLAFPSEKIYIEYHGSGHWLSVEFGDLSRKEFDLKESKRQYFLKSKGWHLIRIISYEEDYLPSDEKIIELVETCKDILKDGRSWVEINIDTSKLTFKDNEFSIHLGELRRIRDYDI